MTTPEASASMPGSYGIRLSIDHPERQSKLTNFPLFVGSFIRLVLLLPHLILIGILQYLGMTAAFISLWGILFTGRYPRGLFNLEVGALRWYLNTNAYQSSLFDDYPPMDLDQRPGKPLQLDVDYPDHPSRWLNLPFFPVKYILAIPHLFLIYVLLILAGVIIFIAQFAILFTGSFPVGMHTFVVGVNRWFVRVLGYLAGFTDKYPPFSLE